MSEPAPQGPRGHHRGAARVLRAPGVLRGPRRPLHRARSTATTSRASSGRCATPPRTTGPIVVHVAHPEGPGLRAGRERRRQAPARHRSRTAQAGQLHRGVHRGHVQARRGAPRAGRHHRGHARLHRAAAVRRALPRPADRRRHRRAARRHVGAAGMAMGGLRPVVAIYSTFLTRAFDQVMYDVGLHRQPVVFAIDRAGITGDDGASHHGVLDMVLLTKVPGMTVLAPSSLPGARPDARRRPRHHRRPRRHPLPEDAGPLGRPTTRSAPGSPAASCAAGADVCLLAVGKLRRPTPRPPPTRSPPRASTATVWDVRCVKPLDPAMLADAAEHPAVVTVEDGFARRRRRLAPSPTPSAASPSSRRPAPRRRCRCSACPSAVPAPGQARRHPRRARPRRRRHRRRRPPASSPSR